MPASSSLHTAWIDKHPAYEILNGPSSYGIDDLFAPEINSLVDNTVAGDPDWTTYIAAHLKRRAKNLA